ncbi:MULTISPECIES: AMP-binding protein [Bacillus]|uniref:phenylacetate--CoA ligase family protein n=1 Tax=Bacillus TaxID=1386 RepID=UPI0028827F61|nr:AMP-binding protein [Bacillus sp. AG4(2022)]MDT0159091.1 AMP-binding protein [Bacillus sp. AG4(2022)]
MILHSIENASRESIDMVQLEGLKSTAAKVFREVPFYRQRFSEANLLPQDIQTLEDLQKLPFTEKADLRSEYPFGLFAVPLDKVVRLHASSGTSGKPTVVGYTKKDIDIWTELVARAIALGGGQPGERLHNAYGYGLFTGGLGLHYGSEHLGMATVPVSGGNTERQIMLIQDFKPSVICGTPSYILNLAEKMEEMGIDPGETSLKYGIFGAEPWSEEMREVLERKLAIKACDIYGLSEVMGPGISMECHEAQDGLHIAEDHFIAEVIDPETLKALPLGYEGELVFTSISKEAFPVIRYRTGDIASLSKEPCRCGRTTARMSRVKGRIDDMLNINGVNVFPSQIESCLVGQEDISPHYQIALHSRKALKSLVLHIELEEGCFSKIGGDLGSDYAIGVQKRLKDHLKSQCYISISVELHPPKSIPRSEGKAVRIIDHSNAPKAISGI